MAHPALPVVQAQGIAAHRGREKKLTFSSME